MCGQIPEFAGAAPPLIIPHEEQNILKLSFRAPNRMGVVSVRIMYFQAVNNGTGQKNALALVPFAKQLLQHSTFPFDVYFVTILLPARQCKFILFFSKKKLSSRRDDLLRSPNLRRFSCRRALSVPAPTPEIISHIYRSVRISAASGAGKIEF